MKGSALTDRIITIGRSYGAGGRTIAQKVALKLNIPYYDSQLLEKAAKESGLSIKYLESQDEQGTTLPTIYQSIGFGTKDYVPLEQKAANAQREIIEKIAAEGPCVIVGRRADLILRGKSDMIICGSSFPEDERPKLMLMQENGLKHERTRESFIAPRAGYGRRSMEEKRVGLEHVLSAN